MSLILIMKSGPLLGLALFGVMIIMCGWLYMSWTSSQFMGPVYNGTELSDVWLAVGMIGVGMLMGGFPVVVLAHQIEAE